MQALLLKDVLAFVFFHSVVIFDLKECSWIYDFLPELRSHLISFLSMLGKYVDSIILRNICSFFLLLPVL